ncbi:ParB/RepB/Spo0J family partition protein [Azotosporobacter soli]|uniref:ParB/RepB/Spo0J family partition protein n=1 Tax=Azotosporobacter soli TaxID=3055040 RepID=UPI0031FEEE56
MNKGGRGLGRGLDALIPMGGASHQVETVQKKNGATDWVMVKDIVANQFQPRRLFDEDALNELVQSIRQYGILQPIVVRKTMQGFELVAGERRWRASQRAGLKEIPAVVKELTDGEMMEIALIENIQRESLNPIEEAAAYRRLMEEFGLTQEEVARKIGRSRSLIANTVRMLNLSPDVQDHVSRGTLSMGQARPLLTLEDREVQLEAAETIIAEGLSSRDAEELVKRIIKGVGEKNRAKKEVEPIRGVFVEEAEDQLKMVLGTQVKIKPGKLKSRIEIEFYSQDDLERIIETLTQMMQPTAGVRVPGQLIV